MIDSTRARSLPPLAAARPLAGEKEGAGRSRRSEGLGGGFSGVAWVHNTTMARQMARPVVLCTLLVGGFIWSAQHDCVFVLIGGLDGWEQAACWEAVAVVVSG